jgi:Protein of unknown function (DUF3179)
MKKPMHDTCATGRGVKGVVAVRRRWETCLGKLTQLLMALLLLAWGSAATAESKNGFNLDDTLIPAKEILSGGPPRDGIPAIDEPKFLPAGEARHIQPSDPVLGIVRNRVAKAYPLAILNLHEVVNDRFNDEDVVVTFCPLCGSGMAYSAKIDGRTHTFGVSGLLYNSDVLLYDRQSESLWSQLMAQAVSGPMKGTRLHSLALSHTTWQEWQTSHPDTLALSPETGYARDYSHNPYEEYLRSRSIWFPVGHTSKRYHPKEQVMGVEIDGRFKAYPFVELGKTSGSFDDTFAGQDLRIVFDKEHRSASVADANGRELPGVVTFWFAWYAFHPQTDVFTTD